MCCYKKLYTVGRIRTAITTTPDTQANSRAMNGKKVLNLNDPLRMKQQRIRTNTYLEPMMVSSLLVNLWLIRYTTLRIINPSIKFTQRNSHDNYAQLYYRFLPTCYAHYLYLKGLVVKDMSRCQILLYTAVVYSRCVRGIVVQKSDRESTLRYLS
ncbi:hypothetical protein HD806DRAFT_259228 [Xylariaceae sp. AK1471]|nr:hypothetical protein HD806DRAFT_259228 [Xylariaceae sp. AK1471]